MRAWPSDSGSGFEVRLEEPDSSRHANSEMLGQKLTTEKLHENPRLDDFFAVSDFIIDNDPAVLLSVRPRSQHCGVAG
jgi:hypothetical protein